MKTKSKIVIGVATAACVGAIGLVLVNLRDPEGLSRRNPASMHAHQKDWPATCLDGNSKVQSPIIITTGNFTDKEISSIKPTFADVNADLVDVGHTFQVRYASNGGSLEFENKQYELKQFHFHKPSEHIVDGKQYEMEVHFVFVNSSKTKPSQKVFVLGYPIDEGAYNSEITKIWQHLPPFKEGYGENPGEVMDWGTAITTHELETTTLTHHEKNLGSNIPVNLKGILPKGAKFYIYEGSLTTPPCDEGVTHAFSVTPIHLGHEQIEHFEGYYEGSNRDIQSTGEVAARKFRRGTMTAF